MDGALVNRWAANRVNGKTAYFAMKVVKTDTAVLDPYAGNNVLPAPIPIGGSFACVIPKLWVGDRVGGSYASPKWIGDSWFGKAPTAEDGEFP